MSRIPFTRLCILIFISSQRSIFFLLWFLSLLIMCSTIRPSDKHSARCLFFQSFTPNYYIVNPMTGRAICCMKRTKLVNEGFASPLPAFVRMPILRKQEKMLGSYTSTLRGKCGTKTCASFRSWNRTSPSWHPTNESTKGTVCFGCANEKPRLPFFECTRNCARCTIHV